MSNKITGVFCVGEARRDQRVVCDHLFVSVLDYFTLRLQKEMQ